MSAADDGLHLTKRLDEISQNGALHGRLTHHADPAVENDIESQYDSDWELQQAENAAQRELTQQNEDGQEAKMLIRIFEDLAQDFGLKFAFFGAVKVFLILSLIAGDASFVVYVIFRLGVALWLGMLVIALFNLVVGIIFLVIATKYKSWEDRKKRREHARNVHRQKRALQDMNYDLRTTLRPGTQAVHRQAHHHRVPTTDLAYAAEAIGPSLEKALPPRVRPIVGNIIENIQKMAPAQGHASNPHHSRGQGSWGTGSGQWASGSGPYTQHQSYAYHHHPHGSSPLGSTDQRTQGAGHLRGHSGDSAGGVGGLARGDRVRTGRTGLGGALMGRSVSVKNAGGDKMMQRVMRHRNKRKGKAKYASPGWKMDERQKELLQASNGANTLESEDDQPQGNESSRSGSVRINGSMHASPSLLEMAVSEGHIGSESLKMREAIAIAGSVRLSDIPESPSVRSQSAGGPGAHSSATSAGLPRVLFRGGSDGKSMVRSESDHSQHGQ